MYWKRKHNGVVTTNCSASAVFTGGASAKVTVSKKEFLKEYNRRSGRVFDAYQIDFTVTIHGLGPDFQGESSISRFF